MEKTFLIIDDDVNIRKMLGIIIKKNNLGRVICELDSGEHGAQEILFYNPSIVLIDLLMPVKDGIETINSATKMGYKGKFIMISQVEDEALVSRAYESGIKFFISKPINNIEVIKVIKGVCENIDLENSLNLIKDAVLNLKDSGANTIEQLDIDKKITNIFTDIGISAVIGSNDLRKIIYKILEQRRKNPSLNYVLQDIYEEVVEEEGVKENTAASKKALEQRVRRTIQKAFTTIAELGCEDYSNSIFTEYSTLIFDFKQIRQEIRHINNPAEEPGKISVKKFIEGIIAKLS
ncbi:DNA-binding domain-containing protein [Clostridium sp. UBA4548]|uniref:DNA-binding domain-containing protein n=1 Tax=Clostridium sp. UBA4548 TaxID=1946361 RepID=UPI0025C1F405|nr:DNA-binding domain-containing protein [Clostridium sp. UBA4548]